METKEALAIYSNRNSRKDELRAALGCALKQLGEDISASTERKSEFVRCRDIFLDAYRAYTRGGYYFSAMDAGALSQLIRKTETRIRDKTGIVPDEDMTVATFAAMVKNIPAWYRVNAFTLTAINKNFNAIFPAIEHEQKQDNGVSDDYIRRKLDVINAQA